MSRVHQFSKEHLNLLRPNLEKENAHDLASKMSNCGGRRDCAAAAYAGNLVRDLSNLSAPPPHKHAWQQSRICQSWSHLLPNTFLANLVRTRIRLGFLEPAVTGSGRYESAAARSRLCTRLAGRLPAATHLDVAQRCVKFAQSWQCLQRLALADRLR